MFQLGGWQRSNKKAVGKFQNNFSKSIDNLEYSSYDAYKISVKALKGVQKMKELFDGLVASGLTREEAKVVVEVMYNTMIDYDLDVVLEVQM